MRRSLRDLSLLVLAIGLVSPVEFPTAAAQPPLNPSGQQPSGVPANTQLPAAEGQAISASTAPLAQVARLPNQPGQPPAGEAQVGSGGPPFQLTAIEQQFVDQVLQMWETKSDGIKTFDCEFERWEYDNVWGPGDDTPLVKSLGKLSYSKPDKGSFKINEVRRWAKQDSQQTSAKPGDWKKQDKEVGAHWVCDGTAVYEYNHEKKQLVVQQLPPEMRGKSIVDGPLPFLFGSDAEKLKRRYWIRSKRSNAASIWLEAYPRTQADAANYHHVEVMLQRKTMLPEAIQVHLPGGTSRAVYMFKQPTINAKVNQLFGAIFRAPRTPWGWTRVVQEPPVPTPPGPQAATPPNTGAGATLQR